MHVALTNELRCPSTPTREIHLRSDQRSSAFLGIHKNRESVKKKVLAKINNARIGPQSGLPRRQRILPAGIDRSALVGFSEKIGKEGSKEKDPGNKHTNQSPLSMFGFNGGQLGGNLGQVTVDLPRLGRHLGDVNLMEQGMVTVSQGKQTLFKAVGVDPLCFKCLDGQADGRDVRFGLPHGVLDLGSSLVGMAAAAGDLIDKIERDLLDVMGVMAGDTGGAPFAERFTVSTLEVVIHDADVAAAAEGGDSRFSGGSEESPGRTHGIGGVGGITSVTVVAGDAVLVVDAAAPLFDRDSAPAGLAAVALQAYGLGESGAGKGEAQQEQGHAEGMSEYDWYGRRCSHE